MEAFRVEKQWNIVCAILEMEWQYVRLQLHVGLKINLEFSQSIMHVLTYKSLHLRVTTFNSSNTSAELYFERKARPL